MQGPPDHFWQSRQWQLGMCFSSVGVFDMGIVGGRKRAKEGGESVQGGDLGFASVFVGDGAAHAGACCHVCGWGG